MKHQESDYIHFDPWEGDESDIRCRTVKLVKVRKQHACFMGAHPNHGDQHIIERGAVARVETALIDGDFWGRSYVCIPCMDKWLDEINGEDDDK
ncbi:hypothetical protein PPMP20_04365 [Paraburkholderia phymatum]|uniref:Uncharacterized protein n=1 Tax=Paraburkholderia phymatum (strain DSM 17167 / CIP 108236 / LMG 21445 / STM815) TaxID=391038 RepID=B2JD20_PARP8|nr:hypothetical protein [Paraburkholderia phymatum]ACC71076.1 conserved hypothetical protein [Paraburkholderia phymatum STM815]